MILNFVDAVARDGKATRDHIVGVPAASVAKEGQSCASVECDAGLFLYCAITDKVCKPVPRAGESCKPDGVCAGGLFCDFTSTTCKELLGAGEPCSGNTCETTLGLACDPTTSTCVSPYAKVGESCNPNAYPPKDCWGSVCVQENAGSAGTCVAWGLEGAACSNSGNSTCSDTLTCSNGVCTSIVDLLDSGAYADAFAAALPKCL